MAEPFFNPLKQATKPLQRLLGRAVLISKTSQEDLVIAAVEKKAIQEKFPYSFTSILLAFLVTDDPISRWFQAYVDRADVSE